MSRLTREDVELFRRAPDILDERELYIAFDRNFGPIAEWILAADEALGKIEKLCEGDWRADGVTGIFRTARAARLEKP